MCRWFAYISPTEPALLADVLLAPGNSIYKQCSEHYLPGLLPHDGERSLINSPDTMVKMRNSLLNMDGLGIAWYTNTASAYNAAKEGMRPALYKSQNPPFNDFNFRNLCENTESKCLFAHIRASSGSAVTVTNCHPFVFGRHTFMHNGSISQFTRIRREMADYISYECYEHIQGSTDSEHAAALYMTYLTEGGKDGKDKKSNTTSIKNQSWENSYSLDRMRLALTKTVTTIMEIQHNSLEKGTITPNSLNFCVTDGNKMVSCRFRNHTTQQPPSLYWSEFAGRKLNRKYPGNPDGPELLSSSSSSTSPTLTTNSPPNEPNPNQDLKPTTIGKHTIIASEPTTYDEQEWHLIGKNNMLLVDEHGVETEVALEYDSKLNGEEFTIQSGSGAGAGAEAGAQFGSAYGV